MRVRVSTIAAACALACPGTAWADASDAFSVGDPAENRAELPPYLQCVPYARERSGVQIYGDAHTWWGQAEGRYARGNRPRVGAVMAFRPTGSMVLGHVAAVSKIVDSRTVLLDHANWSPINGRRGQIERGARAIDVSPANDWSMVRVWYAPLGNLGTTAWPVHGFIYNDRAKSQPLGGARVFANAVYTAPAVQPPITPNPSKKFANAFADLGEPAKAAPAVFARPARVAAAAPQRRAAPAKPRDPLEAALARYNPN